MKTYSDKNILCLCGGVGGAKLALGFSKVLPADNLSIVVNTGDDFEHLDFPISPDIDTVMYTLAEMSNRELGWGIAGETWNFMEEVEKKQGETWFRLGDKDIETHKRRKSLLNQGKSLSETIDALCNQYGVAHKIIPMSDSPVRTFVKTTNGDLPFQHYFVKEQCQPSVTGFYFDGIENAKPSDGFISAINQNPDAIVICPSNPFVSIDPILSIKGVKEKIIESNIPVIAVSPIIGGQAIKGPTAKMMNELSIPKTSKAIAEYYKPLISSFILDNTDAEQAEEIKSLNLDCYVTQTLMKSDQDKINLAEFILSSVIG